MCTVHKNKRGGCLSCPLGLGCNLINQVTQDNIDILQKWSDEHPQMTRKEKFIQMCKVNGFERVIEGNDGCTNEYPKCVCSGCKECVDYWNEPVE